MAAHSSLTMVGRDDELAQLAAVLTDPGQRAMLVAGDAGVGKTRLLRALRDRALGEGWQFFAGHCLDFGDSALPFLPFSEVLGRAAADLPELVGSVVTEHPAIARLQPGRRTLALSEEGQGVAHAADRGDLFAAVHAFLDAAAAQAPVLLVVEDLHWADQSTRDMLGFLFTRPFAHPVAIVASYRSDDLHRRHPLRRQVAEWSRLPRLGRLQLRPLPEPAVRALVHELAPAGLAERVVARIVARAEGNAFFVEELVASGDCGDDVPGDLADLLLVRLDRLSEEARQVVRVASVAGRKVTHEVLAAAADLPPDQLDAGVRQAVEMNVLEVGGQYYSFRHALLGEAIYDDLLPGERVRLHARYVVALSGGAGRGTAAELARHARRANDLDRAVTASIEAGDEALTVGGADEAADHYEQALELLEDAERSERLGIERSKVVVKTAGALTTGGDTLRAAHLLQQHLDRLPVDAPPTTRSRLLSEYASMLTIIETDRDPVALSTEAVRLAPEGESPLRAKVLSTHARVLSGAGRHDDAETFATEALALAERLSMPIVASEVVTTLSGLRLKQVEGDDREALHGALERAVNRAADAGALQAELRGRFLLGRLHQDLGEWDLATRWFRSAVQRGERAALPWAPYSIESRWQLAWVHYITGEWDEALALIGAVDDPAGPVIPRAIVEPTRLAILCARGEDVLARARGLRDLWMDEGGVAVYSSGVEIEIHGARRDGVAAIAVYDDAVAVLSRIWQEHFAGRVRLAAQTLAAVARAVPSATASQRRSLVEQADRLLAEGSAVVDRFQDLPGHWGPEGQMWATRLVAEHLRVRWLASVDPAPREELVAAWAELVQATTKYGHVPEQARVRASYSQILRSVGETAAAREEEDAARELAQRLSAPGLVSDLSTSAPGRQSESSTRTTGTTGRAALTARELEILALVAEGRTNGDIGKQLFIATKTVSVHVSNILGKLGAASRTEAAAIARREGLLA
ncbi:MULTISPECIES: helix-turn-helix transcriptional regulator [Nocardioides]|uniref:AAA family ATPase n=1 Tax=Nocardioides vastitatis TaxID=2568655 RepID=A0ABW0Z8M1_9ACTN|nr:helix-turn-helix transcriptional regulator [Nocardioides sp.]